VYPLGPFVGEIVYTLEASGWAIVYNLGSTGESLRPLPNFLDGDHLVSLCFGILFAMKFVNSLTESNSTYSTATGMLIGIIVVVIFVFAYLIFLCFCIFDVCFIVIVKRLSGFDIS
jgi:hypothetical protein